jgi:hypothetical protein
MYAVDLHVHGTADAPRGASAACCAACESSAWLRMSAWSVVTCMVTCSGQVRGYWWPCSRRWPLGGCRREIYENESTPKFAAENMRWCKSCFKSFCFWLKLSFLNYTVLYVNLLQNTCFGVTNFCKSVVKKPRFLQVRQIPCVRLAGFK